MSKIEKKFHLRREFLRCVFNDPDFIKRALELPQFSYKSTETIKQYVELAIDFNIVSEEIILFKRDGNVKKHDKLYVASVFDDSTGNTQVIVDSQATKSEYLSAWDDILEARKSAGIKPTKRKPSYNYQLIYAINRARKKYTFKEIFTMYSEGNLPLFKGSRNQYKSEDSLEAFYHLHDPTT